jgi:tRNA threonylcarbamoyladenosine biosynthesis protein TsaE
MQAGFAQEISLDSPEATARLARRIAPLLVRGDCLLLEGPIGAGKSHFARSLILERLARAGRSEDVPSPTYTLVQTYSDDITEIWHADLYRLSSPDEVVELGLSDAFDSAICLVEWPDRLGNEAPKSALSVSISIGEVAEQRTFRFHAPDTRWADILMRAMDRSGGTA